MTSLNTQLWELIKTHKMPDDAAGKPFVEQLMADNRISLDTLFIFVKTLNSLTTRGEFTLIFESGDPFADAAR